MQPYHDHNHNLFEGFRMPESPLEEMLFDHGFERSTEERLSPDQRLYSNGFLHAMITTTPEGNIKLEFMMMAPPELEWHRVPKYRHFQVIPDGKSFIIDTQIELTEASLVCIEPMIREAKRLAQWADDEHENIERHRRFNMALTTSRAAAFLMRVHKGRCISRKEVLELLAYAPYKSERQIFRTIRHGRQRIYRPMPSNHDSMQQIRKWLFELRGTVCHRLEARQLAPQEINFLMEGTRLEVDRHLEFGKSLGLWARGHSHHDCYEPPTLAVTDASPRPIHRGPLSVVDDESENE